MLMRKRAWDLMRDDFTTVSEDAGLVEIIRVLREGVETDSDNHIAVVVDEAGNFKGVITMWKVLETLEDCVFSDDTLIDLEGQDWDKAFAMACRACSGKGVAGLMDAKPPSVRPTDPLITVAAEFVQHQRGWTLVRDAEKVLGVIFKNDIFREISRDVLQRMK